MFDFCLPHNINNINRSEVIPWMVRHQVLLSANLSTVQCLAECMHAFFRNSRELFCPAKVHFYEGGLDASDTSLLKDL